MKNRGQRTGVGYLCCVLYGDATEATQEAMDLLAKHAIPYKLTTHHDCLHTPALGTQGGVLRGIERIRGFCRQDGVTCVGPTTEGCRASSARIR